MKIEKISLSWFRGSASNVELNLNSKPLVLYGENGSGKSSFVDAVEYLINEGRISHLAHEHSGRRQEKAIINTHIPAAQEAKIQIRLDDRTDIEAIITPSGASTVSPTDNPMSDWNYRRVVLRQDEVAHFISETKGDKYSALLPLLGLGQWEIAAENIRKLTRTITSQADLYNLKAKLVQVQEKSRLIFPGKNNSEIEEEVTQIYSKYGEPIPSSIKDVIETASVRIQQKIEQITTDQRKFELLLDISKIQLTSRITAVRTCASKLAQSTEPLIHEKIGVLAATSAYLHRQTVDVDISCPACGQSINSSNFKIHVRAEEDRLGSSLAGFANHRTAVAVLCDDVQKLKVDVFNAALEAWRETNVPANIDYLSAVDTNTARSACNETMLQNFESKLIPMIELAGRESSSAPVEIKDLLSDQTKVNTAKELLEQVETGKYILKVEQLTAFLNRLESGYREKIREQSTQIIGVISTDIARMWSILHPGERIENVHLSLPEDVDKAIEIELKFYGVDQRSPRLTLSEGHRNSLGLCIFLSMVKHNPDGEFPIILDDIVASFDRGHRGMVTNLLEQEFPGRQIIILTHDREWYLELRHRLPSWKFKVLYPWENPNIGIRFSQRSDAFDDARAVIDSDPISAGNNARKIMDFTLAVLAEALQISLPYLHRERNDHRTFSDFLPKIISESRTKFELKSASGTYEPFASATTKLEEARRLLLAWANRSSHTGTLVSNEAIQLIDVCEEAVNAFKCTSCGRQVTQLQDTSNGRRQCECGNIRWK